MGACCKKAPRQNLIDAARHLARQGAGADDTDRDLEAFGAPESVRKRIEKDDEFLVLPENWTALEAFMRCQTQWRIAPNGQLSGLDYSGVSIVLGYMSEHEQSDLFEQIQILERAYLEAIYDH